MSLPNTVNLQEVFLRPNAKDKINLYAEGRYMAYKSLKLPFQVLSGKQSFAVAIHIRITFTQGINTLFVSFDYVVVP